MAAYKPKRGDVVMMNFTPQSGKEMKDEHPVLTPMKKHGYLPLFKEINRFPY